MVRVFEYMRWYPVRGTMNAIVLCRCTYRLLYLIVIVLPYSWYSDATMEPVDSTGLPVSPDGIVLLIVNMTYESYLWEQYYE